MSSNNSRVIQRQFTQKKQLYVNFYDEMLFSGPKIAGRKITDKKSYLADQKSYLTDQKIADKKSFLADPKNSGQKKLFSGPKKAVAFYY